MKICKGGKLLELDQKKLKQIVDIVEDKKGGDISLLFSLNLRGQALCKRSIYFRRLNRSGKNTGWRTKPIRQRRYPQSQSIMPWLCFLILREICTWGMCVTTL